MGQAYSDLKNVLIGVWKTLETGFDIFTDVLKMTAFVMDHPLVAGGGLVAGTLVGAWAMPDAPFDGGMILGAFAGVWLANTALQVFSS
jgi:hypothetical protein